MSAIIGYVAVDEDGDIFATRELVVGSMYVKPCKSIDDLATSGPLRAAELREITKCVWTVGEDDTSTGCGDSVEVSDPDDLREIHFCFNCGQRVEVQS